MPRRSRLDLLWVIASIALAFGCGDRDAPPGATAAPPPAVTADAEGLCEHAVVAAACPKCHPKLAVVYEAAGNWCAEHEMPESFCPICHPERGGRPSGEAGKAAAPEPEGRKPPADGTKVNLKDEGIARAMGLEIVKVVPAPPHSSLRVPARVVYDATRTADVNARAAGVVRKVHVDLGATVAAGDVLAVLESADIGKDRAELQGAHSKLELAENNLIRIEAMEKEGIASTKQKLEAQSELERARAEVAALATGLTVMGAGAGAGGSYTLTSPLDGVVTRRGASIGKLVDPEELLFQVVDTSTLWAEIDVPESNLAAVELGTEVVLTFDALPDDRFAGKVLALVPEIDPHTRTALARVPIDNPGAKLRANMFGEASVLGKGPIEAVTIPSAALQTVGKTRLVFVRLDAKTFETRHVDTGAREGGRVVVTRGLKPGEEIVTTGSFLLKTETLKESIGAGCCD